MRPEIFSARIQGFTWKLWRDLVLVFTYIKDLSKYVFNNVEDMERIMLMGDENRSVAANQTNIHSSRSHANFTVAVNYSEKGADSLHYFQPGRLNSVYLTGSEHQAKSGPSGLHLQEVSKISWSLSTFGNVISALADGRAFHVPYHNSNLPRSVETRDSDLEKERRKKHLSERERPALWARTLERKAIMECPQQTGEERKHSAKVVAELEKELESADLCSKTISEPPTSVEISQAIAMVSTCANVSFNQLNSSPKAKMEAVDTDQFSPSTCDITNRVVSLRSSASESSNSSWPSVDVAERSVQKCSNPWLNSIIGWANDDDSVDDSSDDDDSSDWDCEGDGCESENGQTVCELKRSSSELLSPILSPVNPRPLAPTSDLEDYNTDECDEIVIMCDPSNELEEEEARERQLIERRIEDANRRWQESFIESIDVPDDKQKKHSYEKVRFPTDGNLVKIHPMIAWNFAYRNARKSEWERLALDTARFRQRIETTKAILAPVLDAFHRKKIFLRNRENLSGHCDFV